MECWGQEPLRTLHRTPQTMATALDEMLFQCGRAVNWPGTSLSMIVNAAMLLYAWTARVRPALDSYSSRSRCEHLKDADDP